MDTGYPALIPDVVPSLGKTETLREKLPPSNQEFPILHDPPVEGSSPSAQTET